MKKSYVSKIIIYFGLIVFSLMCLLPFLMVIGGSLTKESEIRAHGYQIIPKVFSLKAYQLLFLDPKFIINAYAITITVTVVGTILGLLLTAMMAYPLSVKSYRYRKALSFYIIFTLMFNGGMIPWYIICVNYLHLKDNILALIVPSLLNGFNVILMRNFFESIPAEMYESAKIDGAGDLTIFYKIILRLSTPVLATIALFTALGYWNDWWLGIMFIDKPELKPLQLFLRAIMIRIDFIKSVKTLAFLDTKLMVPTEGIKLATCIVTIGPIIFIYPFLQKFFVKGIMIGAVKG